jgi:hypothetical protein
MSVPMNIEQSVIANLRLLPTERQQDVLVYIHSLLPRDSQPDLRMEILEQVLPALQQIQNFHDGLPSAVYADRLLRSTQALSTQFPDTALGQILKTLHRSLAEENRWGCYTVEYYQTVMQMLTELTDRPTLLPSDVEPIVHRLEAIGQSMIQTGVVTDQELEDYVEV